MDNHSSKLPERRRPSKACSHKSTIWKEDLVSCNQLSQSSRTPSRPSKRSLMSEEWARNERFDRRQDEYKDNQCLLRRQEAGIPVITNIFEAILLLNLS